MSRQLVLVLLSFALSLSASLIVITTATAVDPANESFQQTWARTDQPVLSGEVARTWMWGPEALTEDMAEPYAESPGGERQVQYFDKARMEITHPDTGDPTSIWYVTNGLLVVEMITGQMQIGDASFEERQSAIVNVAGDPDDLDSPTYASFSVVLDEAAHSPGAVYTTRIHRDGSLADDPSLQAQSVTAAIIDEVTLHSIATPFWDFMRSGGLVYDDGAYVEDQLFENPYFATGRPITEAYWATVQVAGTPRDVLMQCFERRCLTYTPGNPEGFIVEAGNVGQHYYSWRYSETEDPEPTPTPLPPPPTPTPPSETGPELEVSQYILREASYGDTTYVNGELLNTGDQAAQNIELVVTIYDNQGSILVSESVYEMLPIIPVGSKSPFILTFFDVRPEQIGDVRFQVQWETFDPDSFYGGYHSIDFETLQVDWNPDRITGEIRNTGEATVSFVSVLVIGYRGDGSIFGVERTYTDVEDIQPGGTSPFTIDLFGDYEGAGLPISVDVHAYGTVQD